MISSRTLAEECRPERLEDMAGHDRIKARLRAVMARGMGGKAVWVSGPSGSGKTALARIIAREVADPFFWVEVDASGLTPAKVEDILDRTSLAAWGKGGHAVFVNEAHGLRKDGMRALLVALEAIPEHVVWLFTTTTAGQLSFLEDKGDAAPLLSRCMRFDLAAEGNASLVQPFAERARAIAIAEGLASDTAPLAWFTKAVEDAHCNLRAVLSRIEAGEALDV